MEHGWVKNSHDRRHSVPTRQISSYRGCTDGGSGVDFDGGGQIFAFWPGQATGRFCLQGKEFLFLLSARHVPPRQHFTDRDTLADFASDEEIIAKTSVVRCP